MIINYGDPDINLLTRKALPGAIKNDLNKNPAWASWRTLRHKQPPIEAWLQTHHGLLKTISKIETATAALMDVQPSELNRAIRFCNLLTPGPSSGTAPDRRRSNLLPKICRHHSSVESANRDARPRSHCAGTVDA